MWNLETLKDMNAWHLGDRVTFVVTEPDTRLGAKEFGVRQVERVGRISELDSNNEPLTIQTDFEGSFTAQDADITKVWRD